jgi:uncharacterized protein
MVKKCLILGGADTPWHQFTEYREPLEAIVKSCNAEAVCTEDCDSLLKENLNDFDCIICCCSEKILSKKQEDGLLTSIAGLDPEKTGPPKAFIGVHCASATFLNSDAYARMLGARFLSHPPQMNFDVHCRQDTLNKGIDDFVIKDELYLMEYHLPFTPVLETEYQGFTLPLAWKKLYGMGKVFYLAPGHSREQLVAKPVKSILCNALAWALASK